MGAVGGAGGAESVGNTTAALVKSSSSATVHLSDWCKHDPADDPIFAGEKVDLYIADGPGCRVHHDEFDFVLDCGDILTLSFSNRRELLSGDADLVKKLNKHNTLVKEEKARILKIDWYDRKAPNLAPAFWVDLAKQLKGTALTACQGGHGRSGTALVCLMMVLNEEYTPADAITHLRAMHCPRAIESKEQHVYINNVGGYLGRAKDVEAVTQITDFRSAFLALELESAKPYQEMLRKRMGGKK
jgi:hypothetical protein